MVEIRLHSMASLTKTEAREFIVSEAVCIKVGKTSIGKSPMNDGSRAKTSKGNRAQVRETLSKEVKGI